MKDRSRPGLTCFKKKIEERERARDLVPQKKIKIDR